MASNSFFVDLSDIQFSYPGEESPVFSGFSGTLPSGFVSLVGPNGSGKSTLMLLASGRLLPQKGTVSLLGRDTRLFLDEEERNSYASFLYQNMEFETQEPVGVLLEQVYASGMHSLKGTDFLGEVYEAFELGGIQGRQLHKLSKGEIQRVLLAFSALYGSRSLFMDEPIFAMEQVQKEKAMEFLKRYRDRTGITIYLSLHELDLTRKYAEQVLLFTKDRTINIGTPEEILTREALEEAFEVPAAMLKQKEQLDRHRLEEEAALLSSKQE